MQVQIKEIHSKKDKLTFIKSQWQFYRDDPFWVPPMISDRYKLIDIERNPFYKHSELKLVLAYKGSEIVGRIAGIVNYNHNAIHKDKTAFFGFFECENDVDTARKLLESVENWLSSKGYDTVIGPVNPSINDEIGMLIDGFDSPPVLMMTYNPRYYNELMDSCGYTKAKDVYAYLLEPETFITEKAVRMQEVIKKRYNIVLRDVNLKNNEQFKRDVQTLKDIYNSAWEPNWGFVKWTDEEFDFIAKDLKMIADPRLAIIVEAKGKIAGFGLALPNINECLIYNRRGSTIGALYHILTKKKRIKFIRIIALGIMPEFQKTGIDSILYYEIGTRALKLGYRFGEASWILEDNEMMNRALTSTMGGHIYKRYRLYQKRI